MGDRGWICPKCDRSVAPRHDTCPRCETATSAPLFPPVAVPTWPQPIIVPYIQPIQPTLPYVVCTNDA